MPGLGRKRASKNRDVRIASARQVKRQVRKLPADLPNRDAIARQILKIDREFRENLKKSR